jgi:hypothetical protein
LARAGAWSSTCGLVAPAEPPDPENSPMDLVSLGLVAVFFALSWGFVELCERL